MSNKELNFWNSVIEISGPQAFQIKRVNLTLRTVENFVRKKDLQLLINEALNDHATVEGVPVESLRGVVYGPFYIGHMTLENFEGQTDGS